MQLSAKQKVLILLLLIIVIVGYFGFKFIVHKPYEQVELATLDVSKLSANEVPTQLDKEAKDTNKLTYDQLLQQYQTLKNKRIVLDDQISNIEQKITKINSKNNAHAKEIAAVASSSIASSPVAAPATVPVSSVKDSSSENSQYSSSGNIFSRLKDKFSKKAQIADMNAKLVLASASGEKNKDQTPEIKNESAAKPIAAATTVAANNVEVKDISVPPSTVTAPDKNAKSSTVSTSDISNLIATLQKDKSQPKSSSGQTANSVSSPAQASATAVPVIQPAVKPTSVSSTTVSTSTVTTVPISIPPATVSQPATPQITKTEKKKLDKVVIISSKKSVSEQKSTPVVVTAPEVKPAVSQPQSMQTGNYYVLQVMSGNKSKFITDYINSHKIGDKAVCLKVKRNGADWYLLAYGHYATQQEAKNDIANLKSTLKGTSPWIRLVKENEGVEVR